MIKQRISPVIVIGMHRSGTSLLSELLKGMGVFMGADWEKNNESEFFIKINEWLLKQAGVCWQEPKSFLYIPNDFKAVMVEIIHNRLKSYHRYKYLGTKRNIRSLEEMNFTWGWKDPRNTFTWEIWKEIFPEAKVIHLYRNPLDVVLSLNNREPESFSLVGNPTRTGLKKKYLGYFLPRKRIFIHSFRAMNMQGSYELWREYIEKALTINELYPERILHLSYEDLVDNPFKTIESLGSFIGFATEPEKIEGLLSIINPNRRFVFKDNPVYKEFYDEIKNDPLVKKLGYDKL